MTTNTNTKSTLLAIIVWLVFGAALASVLGCDQPELEADLERELEAELEAQAPEIEAENIAPPLGGYPAGSIWGPCDGSAWGCAGALGQGLACARPLAIEPVSICVAQTWDPAVGPDCAGILAHSSSPPPPSTEGLAIASGSYCVASCAQDDDCESVMVCSSFGFCAWPDTGEDFSP